MTHAIHDDVGGLYQRCNEQKQKQRAEEQPTAAASASSPHASAPPPSAPSVSLGHDFSVRFHIDFRTLSSSFLSAPTWFGSDLWAVSQGFVSVTPLSSALTECEHTHPELRQVAEAFPPEGNDACAAGKTKAREEAAAAAAAVSKDTAGKEGNKLQAAL